MKAGELRQAVTIENKTITGVGDRGQPVITWGSTTVRAKVEDLTGRKLENARQLVPTASHKVTIRYYTPLDIGDRIGFGNYKLQIGAILNKDNTNFTLEIICTRTPNES